MPLRMTFRAQSYQIRLGIITCVTPESLVMDFQVRHRAT